MRNADRRERVDHEIEFAPDQQAGDSNRDASHSQGDCRDLEVHTLEHGFYRVCRTTERRVEHRGDTGASGGCDEGLALGMTEPDEATDRPAHHGAHLNGGTLGTQCKSGAYRKARPGKVRPEAPEIRDRTYGTFAASSQRGLRGVRRNTVCQPGCQRSAEKAGDDCRKP
jgi:hypothetical protein